MSKGRLQLRERKSSRLTQRKIRKTKPQKSHPLSRISRKRRRSLPHKRNTCQLMKEATKTWVHYRRQLLRVSRNLSTQDVKQLLFICPIPKSQEKTVREGFQLFELLEQQGLLGPDNYSFLLDSLQQIQRTDMVQTLSDPDVAKSFQLTKQVQITLTQSWDIKRKLYKSCTKEVITVMSNNSVWITALEKPFKATFLDLHWSPSIHSSDIQQVDSTLIHTTICEAFSLADTFFAMLKKACCCHPLSEEQVLPSIQQWHRQFQKFNEQCLTATTKLIPEGTLEMGSEQRNKEYPGVHQVRKVKEYIEQVGKLLLGEEAIEEVAKGINRSLWVIESFVRAGFSWFITTEWLASVVVLANSSKISLRGCYSNLEAIAKDHSKCILKSYDTLRQIVGQDIMDKVLKILQLSVPDASQRALQCARDTPHDIFEQTVQISFNTFLVLLVALASDSTVNTQEVGKKFTEFYSSQKTRSIILKGIAFFSRRWVEHVMEEVEQFRSQALEMAKSRKPSIQETIMELLPTVRDDL